MASRVKEQVVILYLLRHEFRNLLVCGGPYHGVFRRRAGKGARGFCINVTGHATVLAAGFIVLEFRIKDVKERTHAGEKTDARERERKVYTELQDTLGDARGPPLVFNHDEGLGVGGEKQEPGSRTIRLKTDDKVSSIDPLVHEILGLPSSDWGFSDRKRVGRLIFC